MADSDKMKGFKPRSAQQSPPKFHYPFWFGGSASCMATGVTHPLDLLKVRLQTRKPGDPAGMFRTMIYIIKNNGVFGLYNGLSASLLRGITYSTTRFGVYEELKSRFTTVGSSPSLPTLVSMASIAGFAGGLVGNPADVLNVRMQSDAALPPAQRRNYKHAFHGLIQMVRMEGASSLFRGLWPNSARAILMNASQLATYDFFKSICMRHFGMSDNINAHFTASLMAGFIATSICSPVDVIKTRIMTASPAESKGQGIIGLLKEVVRKEGYSWMFRGWTPSFVRLAPQTIATFLFLEEHKKIYRALNPPAAAPGVAI
ncbi:uncharacterized protein PADG_06994 [Paracoccidioides brasiliensis Pb18]|uniref:Mitochondrial thiamine pyrophosphate carrier 1 n=2 Tax=Paracoccidioides brasiliensis TaxID=121759 RepID=C1GIA8_PARBD|nr:uncharacterized protein PADG_06994 [Paracoccidioides brasiliensis Pb18]EEH42174.2 hypothetical protein PADG_06994 [Paracoccidioides brasiliensis Pb18]ODH38269.1 hypothetical protein ACO22_02452 [Paracoccidioides brasiliensis]ODH49198.1 hypothetical protein GX48_04705 [Paracoccidioides brasiliensis]